MPPNSSRLHALDYPSTYRLQLHAGFTFADAAEQVPYLAELGVTRLYLSPVLQAMPGSMHGYDVVDHTTISADLGGRSGLEALASTAREAGLGLLVDVVPNHMTFATPLNRPLWDTLRDGPEGERAHWFDIDWDAADGRLVVPMLGKPTDEVLAEGDLRLDELDGEPVLRYFDHVFPVAAGTAEGDAAAVLARQHYLLVDWREADRLNYRRFFDVTSLIAVRVELEDVFVATHLLLLDLHHAGVIDGFRIDHPDGLADPQGYLERLESSLRPGTPVYVEKILEGAETLDPRWATAGTTGYDAAKAIAHTLLDPTARAVLDETWAATGGSADFHAEVDRAKRQVVERLLRAEVDRLARGMGFEARALAPQPARSRDREALVEVLVAAEVYRIYVRPGEPPSPQVSADLAAITARAVAARPDLAEEIHGVMARIHADGAFAARLQQTWGPVMAKGIEDTAGYRWNRFVALNEVGSDPVPAVIGPEALHAWADHQAAAWPVGMTTLSTHDTKRSEDVRARLLAFATDAEGWRRCADVFREHAGDVDLPTVHFLWQTLAGAGPIGTERLHGYLTKALREAKLHTVWTDPDEAYEARVLALADRATAPGPMRDALNALVDGNQQAVRRGVLGQKLLQLLAPGAPDVYQGCELVDLSLVDPDNRRPVDFGVRRSRLSALANAEPPRDLDDEKLHVVRTALAVRRDHGATMRGSYAPVAVPDGLVAFRTGDVLCAVTLPQGCDPAAVVRLPDGGWHDALSGAAHAGAVSSDVLFAELPVALLVSTEATDA